MALLNQQQANIEKGLDTLKTAKQITPQTANEISSDIAAVIAGKSVNGIGNQERADMHTLMGDIAARKQYGSNEPVDLRNYSPAVVQYLQESLDRLNHTVARQQSEQADRLSAGKEYSHIPEAKRTLDTVVKGYKKRVKTLTPAGKATMSYEDWVKAGKPKPGA